MHFSFRKISKTKMLTLTFTVLDRCTQIEKANRILLERMTEILAGPGENFPQHKKGYMPPIHPLHDNKYNSQPHIKRGKKCVTQSKSLNMGARMNDMQRITAENE